MGHRGNVGRMVRGCWAVGVIATVSACASAGPTALTANGGWTRSAGHAGAATAPASRTATASAASVTIAAVGDTMLGNTPNLAPDPGAYFDAVKPILDPGAQIVFGNLEGTLTDTTGSKCGPPPKKPGKGKQPAETCFAFRNPPDYARYFKQAGFTLLNDANNHVYDFGAAGQAQTVQSIRAAGLAQTGLPGEVTMVRANGVSVAFIGFAPYPYDSSLLDLPTARDMITRARGEAQIVVVYMHAGAEGAGADHVTGQEEVYLGEDRGNAEAFAHMAIDAGASLVIASGPHVLRGMQFYKGHLICYSLGNFAGYGNFNTYGVLDESVILHATLSSSGTFERARIYPVQFSSEGQPSPGGGAVAFVAGLSVADFGSAAARIDSSGVIRAP